MIDVDALAQEIRRVDGENKLGAGALADALMPFIDRKVRDKIGEAFDEEIARVSHLEYDSNSICRHFYKRMMERIDDAIEAPEYVLRRDAAMPYQTWRPFPDDEIVEVVNVDGEKRVGRASSFWWGYEWERGGNAGEGVIVKARIVSNEE